MSNVIVSERIVSVSELFSMSANGAKIEKVQIERVSVLTGDISSAVVSDLCHSDSPRCLEDVKDQRALNCPLFVDKEFVLRHFTLLMLTGCPKVALCP